MAEAEEYSLYRVKLMRTINAIDRVIPLKAEDQVLIVLELDTTEKIQKWFNWIRERLTGENDLQATAEEVVRAAVHINKGWI